MRRERNPNPRASFKVQITQDGCWRWSGNLNSLKLRRVYQMVKGQPAPKGKNLVVTRNCRNWDCVAPEHLEVVTLSELRRRTNATGDKHYSHTHPDKLAKGDKHYSRLHPEKLNPRRGDEHPLRLHPELAPMGEKNGMAKLTGKQVYEIRALGRQAVHRANSYGVSPRTIRDVLSRRSWRHLAQGQQATI